MDLKPTKIVLSTTIFLFLITQSAWANQTYRLIQRSTTGRTIILNVGSLDGVRDNDVATVLKKNPLGKMDYYTELVAQCKSIKVLNNRSIWFCFKLFKEKLLRKGKAYLVGEQSKLMRGRKKPSVKRRKIVTKKGNEAKSLKDYFRGTDEDYLTRNDYSFTKQERLKNNIGHTDYDFEVIDFSSWDAAPSKLFDYMESQVVRGRKFYPKDIYTSPRQSEFLARRNLDTYEKMIVNYLEKVNDPNFSYKELYYEKLGDDNPYRNIQSNGIRLSTYDLMKNEQKERLRKTRATYRKLLTQGPNWSDEYSDEDLERLIYEKGIMDEEERRRILVARKHSYQITASMGFNMVNNENVTDTTNTEQFKIAFELGYEYYLARRYPRLEDFTFELSFRGNQDAYSIGDSNAVATEYSLNNSVYWYPWFKPNVVEENLFFFGLSFRFFGRTNLDIPANGEQGIYSVSSVPGIRAGVKYNFRSNWGLRVLASYENLVMTRIERNFVGDLPESLNATDMKVSFGVSYFH